MLIDLEGAVDLYDFMNLEDLVAEMKHNGINSIHADGGAASREDLYRIILRSTDELDMEYGGVDEMMATLRENEKEIEYGSI